MFLQSSYSRILQNITHDKSIHGLVKTVLLPGTLLNERLVSFKFGRDADDHGTEHAG